ncbi:MAG: acetyl-CoA carboxylase biotin carboxyl carrier protein [Pirellulaceae bacterium]|nr:acetyl-CoA carboxylase biotin carboxyl carrier protein [Pirellulaceae bacterium]
MADGENPERKVFDVERIRELVELMKEHDLSEVDLRQADQRIRLARGPLGHGPVPQWTAIAQPAAPSGPAAPSSLADEAASPAHLVGIKSPMVGTFYSRPNPNAPAFVKVGDHVEPETTVCIIEAMKVFNEIPAEVRGKIVAVLVDDEEPLEFGKPLFKVDTRP